MSADEEKYEPVDETTDVRGLRGDHDRVRTAEIATERTQSLVEEFRGIAGEIKFMYDENHYTPRLREIFMGGR